MRLTRPAAAAPSIIIIVLSSLFAGILAQERLSNQLIHILTSLQPFRAQICQFKFENCIQDSSYADQLDTDCNIYSRLRDCFRSLLDEPQCLSSQLKRQYKQAKQNEYEACGISSSYESIRSAVYTSSSSARRPACLVLVVASLLRI